MTEQQRLKAVTRETSPLPIVTDVTRVRPALDDRCEAVKRWIGDDDDSCCRGID